MDWFCSGFYRKITIYGSLHIFTYADQTDIDGRGRLDLFDGDFNLLDRHFFNYEDVSTPSSLSIPIFTWDITMNMFRLKKKFFE